MMGLASSAPQALQGMTQPLSQVAQVPQQIGGQLSGMLGAMPGMGGGPGGGLGGGRAGQQPGGFDGRRQRRVRIRRWRGVGRADQASSWRYGWPGRVALCVVGARLGRRRLQRIGAEQACCGRTCRGAGHGCGRGSDGFGNVWHAAGRGRRAAS